MRDLASIQNDNIAALARTRSARAFDLLRSIALGTKTADDARAFVESIINEATGQVPA